MPARIYTLTRRADFQRLTRHGRKKVMPGLIVQALESSQQGGQGLRIGFTVSRRVGGAVIRNRAKRRLRAVAREVLANDAAGHDVVIVGRKDTPRRPFQLLVDDLRLASTELGIVSKGRGA